MTFDDLEFQPMHSNGIQARHAFANGYGVSVVRHDGSYGNREGLYEVALLKNGRVCYDKEPFINDVVGWCDEKRVTELLAEIEAI